MPNLINIKEFLEKAETIPVVDVRAPIEFEKGHIPGALNIPLFNNDQRAEIGTLYKQEGHDPAIDLGLAYAGKAIPRYIKAFREIAPDKEVLIHCWRGGMRSSSMAWLVETAGMKPYVLDGGYKSFRRHIRQSFEEKRKIIILSGMTGCGKTEVLYELAQLGQQILDLEGIAHHKGSAFGSLGQEDQPTTEQFENDTWNIWKNFDKDRVIWIEDESRKIGCVVNNEPLYNHMRESHVIKMDIPRQERVKRLVKEYGFFKKDTLLSIVEKITKRLGGQNAREIIHLIEEDEFSRAIDMTLDYYDKSYTYGIEKRDSQTVFSLSLPTGDARENAKALLDFYSSL